MFGSSWAPFRFFYGACAKITEKKAKNMPAEQPDPSNPVIPDDALTDEASAELDSQLSREALANLAEQFNPYTETDEEGLTRTIFRYGQQSFAFAGRDETPSYPTEQHSQPVRLGRQPVRLTLHPQAPKLSSTERQFLKEHGLDEAAITKIDTRNREQWQEEHDRLAGYPAELQKIGQQNPDKPKHFIVETSPYGIYALLAELQPDNTHWAAQRDSVAAGQYNDETLALIDAVTALEAVELDQQTLDERQTVPLIGEAVVVAGLLGDQRAQLMAEQAVRKQISSESNSKATNPSPEQQNSPESLLKPSEIVVVHTTSHRPQASDGGLRVVTSHDATGFPRATIHTSLNHKVESHMAGDWDNSGYVLMSNLQDMVNANGIPESINGADTWWARNPGESLLFPNATLICPGEEQEQIMSSMPNGEVRYKASNYNSDDLKAVSQVFGPEVARQFQATLEQAGIGLDQINSAEGQRIMRNLVRDAVVNYQISTVRQAELMQQSDDKYMSANDQQRLDTMARAAGWPIAGILHAESDESAIEDAAFGGDRMAGRQFKNGKVRRTAYASGLTRGGSKPKPTAPSAQEDMYW